MQINLTGHHVDITEPLKGYVDTKFDRLARHFDDVINVHVILSVEKLRQKAEATIHINGANVFADAVHEDMYAAIDGLIDKLDRQVIKYKEKRKSHRGNGQKAVAETQAEQEAALAADALAQESVFDEALSEEPLAQEPSRS
jgi:putative sigma-54 modulation protein